MIPRDESETDDDQVNELEDEDDGKDINRPSFNEVNLLRSDKKNRAEETKIGFFDANAFAEK